jgi:hypothetical protein
LVKNQQLLKDWHIVRLTRNNKINHWISFYIWKYFNTHQQRLDDTNLPHHGGTRSMYKNLPKVTYDLDNLDVWLLEQYPINLFRADVDIDYDDLSNIEGTDIGWTPNDYGLTLSDLFDNHEDVHNKLKDWTVPVVN